MNNALRNKTIDNFEYALGYFNFYKVKIAMTALDWTWALCAGGTPTVDQMEDEVRRLFVNAFEEFEKDESYHCHGCGGFSVSIFEEGLVRIEFTVEEASSEGNEG